MSNLVILKNTNLLSGRFFLFATMGNGGFFMQAKEKEETAFGVDILKMNSERV